MSWLRFLHNAGWITQIAVNVTALYYIYPLYKRTRHKGFLLWGFALLVATFDVICDHTIGLSRMTGATYYIYFTARYLAYIAVNIVSVIGTILIIRSFLDMHASLNLENPADKPAGVPITINQDGSSTLTCPSCGTDWELTPAESRKSAFTCQECNKVIEIDDNKAGDV